MFRATWAAFMAHTEAQTVSSVPVMWKDILQVMTSRVDTYEDQGIKVTTKTKDRAKVGRLV
jgi:hypothetical protein